MNTLELCGLEQTCMDWAGLEAGRTWMGRRDLDGVDIHGQLDGLGQVGGV